MAYPVLINGSEGEQFNNYDARRWPLGTRMILQDGRRFAFGAAGGTALVAGKVAQSPVPNANFDTLVLNVTGAVGDRQVGITTGATATSSALDEGILITEAVAGDGEGRMYKIDEGVPVIGTSSDGNIPLAAGSGLQTVITAAADTITIMNNPYEDIIISGAPPAALILGVSTSPIPIDNWGWIQTWGPCAVLIDNTVIIGGRVSPSGTLGSSVAGSVEASGRIITTTAPTTAQTTELLEFGICMEVAPTTGFGAIFLKVG